MYYYLLFTSLLGELTLSNGSSISEIPLWQIFNDEFFLSITLLGSNLQTQQNILISWKYESKITDFRKIPS